MNYEFRALEGGGGGLHIFITNRDELIYAATGLEYNKGELSRLIVRLCNNEEAESWDGNIIYDEEILKEIRSKNGDAVIDDEGCIIPMTNNEADDFFGCNCPYGMEVVADHKGIYWDKMGDSAQKDFALLSLGEYIKLKFFPGDIPSEIDAGTADTEDPMEKNKNKHSLPINPTRKMKI